MKIEQHVTEAFGAAARDDFDSSLMHACFALDGSGRKYFGKDSISAKDYKKFIRDYYWLIEPMIGAGIDLQGTIWYGLNVPGHKGELISQPDFADIVYHIFRCSHAHCKEIPKNFGFTPYEDSKSRWVISENVLYMPTRVVWALLAVSIFVKTNSDIVTKTKHILTWGAEKLGIKTRKFPLDTSWGQEAYIFDFFERQKIIRVTLDLSAPWAK